MAPIKMYCTV